VLGSVINNTHRLPLVVDIYLAEKNESSEVISLKIMSYYKNIAFLPE
jgi:hypothetical protein